MTKTEADATTEPSASSQPARRQPRGLAAFFLEASPALADDVAPTLWNDPVDEAAQGGERDTVLEQYKLYVEMADRVSQRRALANTFFLTLNTAIMTTIGVFWKERPDDVSGAWLVFPLVALLTQCLAWFWTIRSYRQLNSGKWAVVGALESRLSASPWWRAEWAALGEGKDPARYWPLTHVEQVIPLIFAGVYLSGSIALLVA